jgi:PAS domain S-box-containing protein
MSAGLPPPVIEYVRELEFQDAGALVAVFDKDGYYLYASPNHEHALGYTAQELESMHLSDTVHRPHHHAAWVLRTVAVLHAKPMRFSSTLVSRTGELVPVSGTLRHMRERGGEMHFITFVRPSP